MIFAKAKWPWIVGAALSLVLALAIGVAAYLSTFDYNRLKPEIAAMVQEATGRRLSLTGDLHLDLFPNLALRVQKASLANASWGSAPEMVTVGSLSLRVDLWQLLKGRVEIQSLGLEDVQLHIEITGNGQSNLVMEPEPGAATGSGGPQARQAEITTPDSDDHTVFSIREITAQNLRVRLSDRRIKQDTALAFDTLSLKIPPDGPASIIIKGSLNDTPVELAAQLAISPGQGKARVYRLSGLKAKLGPSDISGDLTIKPGLKTPLVTGSLQSKVLDLNHLLGKGNAPQSRANSPGSRPARSQAEELAPKSGENAKKVIPDTPFNLGFLKAADLDLKYQCGWLKWDGPALKDLSVHLKQQQGRLQVKPLEAHLAGGLLDGSLELSSPAKGQARLELSLSVGGAKLTELAKEAGETTISRGGSADLLLRISGKGPSLRGLLTRAKGQAVLQVMGGKVSNSLLGFLGGPLLTNLFSAINPLAKTEEYTDLKCLITRLDLADGKAVTAVFFLETDTVICPGHGSLDLKSEQISLGLHPKPKSGIGIKGVAELDVSLQDLIKPFKLGGTLADPQIVLAPAQALLAIGKSALGFGLLGPAGALTSLAGGSFGEKADCNSAAKIAWKRLARPKAQ